MPVLNRIWGTMLALAIALFTFSSASARHPHWGCAHGHYHGYGGYRSLGIYSPSVWGGGYGWGSYGWGGYGWGGYGGLAYSNSISFGYSRFGYRGLGYGSWYARPAGYSSFYASYYIPSVTYYAPSALYCAPSPTYYQPYFVPSVNYYDSNCCLPSCCDSCLSASDAPLVDAPTLAPASATPYTAPDDATGSAPSASTIPASLLATADAIFEAGGYRQAATAYAQLHVKYGSSDQIFERRFIAQVACGDLDQAAVVLASAHGAGFPIELVATAAGDLNPLFESHPDLVRACTERLAQHALQADCQREPLEMMATWLNLTGQPQRAGLFLAMVERLSHEADDPIRLATPAAEIEVLPLPTRSQAALVSLEQ